MPDREKRGIAVMRGVAANDDPGSEAGTGSREPGTGAGGGAEARIDSAVVTLARLIGRRIAREHFEAIRAANDNAPEKDASER